MLMSRAPCSADDLSTVVDTSLVTIPRSDSSPLRQKGDGRDAMEVGLPP